jgi:hypothetical protein
MATLSNHWRDSYYHTEPAFVLCLGKYVSSISYVGGAPGIHPDGDGGAFDPAVVVETLKGALEITMSCFCGSQHASPTCYS